MNQHYDGFAHAANELSAYIYGAGIFVISLKNKQVINHEPKDEIAFRQWLTHHGIRNVARELPQHIYDALIKEEKEKK